MKSKRKGSQYFKFKAWLSENGINQVEVADMLGVTLATINKKINGTGGEFLISEVREICNHYDISADDFFINNKVSK